MALVQKSLNNIEKQSAAMIITIAFNHMGSFSGKIIIHNFQHGVTKSAEAMMFLYCIMIITSSGETKVK